MNASSGWITSMQPLARSHECKLWLDYTNATTGKIDERGHMKACYEQDHINTSSEQHHMKACYEQDHINTSTEQHHIKACYEQDHINTSSRATSHESIF